MKKLLRADEAAAMLRVSRAQVYAMAARGEIPAVKFGERAVRFPAEELENWVTSRISGLDGRPGSTATESEGAES